MNLKLYFITLGVFFVIDMLWLGFFARKFYAEQIGFLMTENVNWYAALTFYLVYISGLVLFVITPAIEKQSWQQALLFGAFFGFVTYATYDLTNLATLKNWPLLITIVDLIWGTVLCSSVSLLSFQISNRLN